MNEPKPGNRLSMEDLVGATIVDADGNEVGRVVDVETTIGPPMRVIGLVVGGFGWLHRLRVARRLRRTLPGVARIDVVPWEDVASWDRLRVILKPRPEAGPRTEIAF